MQCPTGDGELISHSTPGENSLSVIYSTCPACHGHWMESFAANFIKLAPEELRRQRKVAKQVQPAGNFTCPICRKRLTRTTGDNIPDAVSVFTCPDGHGYFFPAGQLAAWKNAQSVKISYHKLWNIPLPSVGSVLLTGFLIAVVTGGLVAGLTAVQNRQTTSSQAKQFLSWQRVFVLPESHDLLVSAETQDRTQLTVHISDAYNYQKELETRDGLTHTLFIQDVPSGTYRYHFSWRVGASEVRSDTFTVDIP